MIAVAAEKYDLGRWLACGALVVGLHAAGVTALAFWREPIPTGEAGSAILVELAPVVAAAPAETVDDVTPGPLQQKFEPPPEQSLDKPEDKVEEKVETPQPEAKVEDKIEPPPEVKPEVTLPPPEPVRPARPKPVERPRAPATTAPQHQPRVAALPTAPAVGTTAESRAATASWHGQIQAQIERHKGYPEEARARGERGTAQIAFTLNRQGRVLASHLVRSSGVPALDQETLATVRRAQPFPPPPASVPGTTFPFSVPIRFNIR